MPDTRQHRGQHPADGDLFSQAHHSALRAAVADLSWMLTRDYSMTAALKLVGDHFQLTARQRIAAMRSACSDQSIRRRRETCVDATEIANRAVAIDGFNLLTTIEAVLSGGVLLIGRDGCCRDMASMHGSYRKVEETIPALEIIGETLKACRVERCRWLFDRPVSNSGRIATIVRETAAKHDWNWTAEVVADPDAVLIRSKQIVVSADSVIIDQCATWTNLAHHIVVHMDHDSPVVDFTNDDDRPVMV